MSIAKKVFEVSKEEKMSHEERASMLSYTTVAFALDPFLESYDPLLSIPWGFRSFLENGSVKHAIKFSQSSGFFGQKGVERLKGDVSLFRISFFSVLSYVWRR